MMRTVTLVLILCTTALSTAAIATVSPLGEIRVATICGVRLSRGGAPLRPLQDIVSRRGLTLPLDCQELGGNSGKSPQRDLRLVLYPGDFLLIDRNAVVYIQCIQWSRPVRQPPGKHGINSICPTE
jgi:hypothetical protein